METTESSVATARRNRAIAILAGVIAVTAIIVAFAADYLELPWKWLRPAAELLLFGELVGLIVLERHQLFEPMHDAVGGIQSQIADMRTNLNWLTERARASGNVTLYANYRELFRAQARALREALARDQESPQCLRIAALSGYRISERDPGLFQEGADFISTIGSFLLLPGSPSDSRTRWWIVRQVIAVSSVEHFDNFLGLVLPLVDQRPLNYEVKFLVQPRPSPLLSVSLCTDREVFARFDDASSTLRWGLMFRGLQYNALFTRWFEDVWAGVPDSYTVCSREGLNQKAVDFIKKELQSSAGTREV